MENKQLIRATIDAPMDHSVAFDEQGLNAIKKYNEFIAKYMGYKYFQHETGSDIIPGWKKHEKVSNWTKMNTSSEDYLCRTWKGMKFHYSWDSLMPVIQELYIRHEFIVITHTNSAVCIHREDFVRPQGAAYGLPKHFNVEKNSSNLNDGILAAWEVVAATIEYIMTYMDPKIPVVDKYEPAGEIVLKSDGEI